MKNFIRPGIRKFYDDEHFCGGIERSGFFTISEANFLIQYGDTLHNLSNGIFQPETSAESEFVACIQSDIASNTYEVKLWSKYLKALYKVNHGVSVNSSTSNKNTKNEAYDY